MILIFPYNMVIEVGSILQHGRCLVRLRHYSLFLSHLSVRLLNGNCYIYLSYSIEHFNKPNLKN